jgi:16S rRNA (guanine1207-N2)-methyltransferase
MTETPAQGVEHYFSASPAGEFRSSEITVEIDGKTVTVETAGGIFSPDHIDAGTEALLRIVDEAPATGNLLDIGCGWGPIALTLAAQSPEATVYAVDVNERAIELTRRNAARLGASNVIAGTPETVSAAIEFDAIWSNPPIRVGKAELHSIMHTWIPRLKVGATAWLVIAKHLGADSFEKWLRGEFANTHTIERADHYKGFRVITVTRTA